MRLQLEQSSCKLSRWSVPPRERGTRWSTSTLQLEGEIALAKALLLAEQDVLVLAVGNGRLDVGTPYEGVAIYLFSNNMCT